MSSASVENDVESVITLAQAVVDACRSLPQDFAPGATAANGLVSTLRDFQIYTSTSTIQVVTLGSSEGTLTAHLEPCRQALRRMRNIQQNFGQRRTVTRLMVGSDKEKFERETSALNNALNLLREMVQELRRGTVRRVNGELYSELEQPSSSQDTTLQNSTPPQDNSREATSEPTRSESTRNTPPPPDASPRSVPITIMIVNQPGHSSGYTQPPQPPAFPAPTPQPPVSQPPAAQQPFSSPPSGRLPMCRGGSGCRAPLCHKRFDHPRASECSRGKNCSTAGCSYWHPKSAWCPDGRGCNWKANNCKYAHPWPFQESSSSPPNSQTSFVSAVDHSQENNRPGIPPTLETRLSDLSLVSPLSQPAAPASVQSPPPPSSSSQAGTAQPWCEYRFNCPGGYNGQCPYRHPRRAACRDGSACTKGSACTFDHSGPAQARAPFSPARSRTRRFELA